MPFTQGEQVAQQVGAEERLVTADHHGMGGGAVAQRGVDAAQRPFAGDVVGVHRQAKRLVGWHVVGHDEHILTQRRDGSQHPLDDRHAADL